MKDGTYVVETAATEDVTPRDRAEFWRERTSAFHALSGLRYADQHDVRARAVRQRSDGYQLVEWDIYQPQYVYRTPQQIRKEQDEDYRLFIPTTGTTLIRQGDTETAMRPGYAALFTLNVPFGLTIGPRSHGVVLTLPRTRVDDGLQRSYPTATLLDLQIGLGRILSDMLTALAAERENVDCRRFEAVCERVVELISLLAAGYDRPGMPDQLIGIENAVRRYVRDHVDDPRLNGERVAAALGWSLRQVQRALHEAGTTPRSLIRKERLRLANERLRSPLYRPMTIEEIAASCGFSSPTTFSTQFRHEYGARPRDLR